MFKEIKFERDLDDLETKKVFPEITIHKIFETDCSFRVR